MAKKTYTFSDFSPEQKARCLQLQRGCSHSLWTPGVSLLVNAQGLFGCSGERGYTEVKHCLDCGKARGMYYSSGFAPGVPYELFADQNLVSLGVIRLP